MEHFCQNIHGWCNFYDLYSKMLDKLPNNFSFAEIGVWKGRSLAYFVVESIKRNKQGHIYAIDHWLGSKEHLNQQDPSFEPSLVGNPDGLYELFLNNVSPIRDKINIIREQSVEASKQFDDLSLDAIFIDASHEYEDVLKDLEAWYPKKKEQGFFCGHDYDWPGVKKAVDEFSSNRSLLAMPISQTSWIII